MPNIEQGMRMRIAQFLPKALERALASYKMISLTHPVNKTTKETDMGEAKKQHDACKVTIAHIELLLKLARWADLPDNGARNNDGVTQSMLQTMLETARGEVDGFNHKNG